MRLDMEDKEEKDNGKKGEELKQKERELQIKREEEVIERESNVRKCEEELVGKVSEIDKLLSGIEPIRQQLRDIINRERSISRENGGFERYFWWIYLVAGILLFQLVPLLKYTLTGQPNPYCLVLLLYYGPFIVFIIPSLTFFYILYDWFNTNLREDRFPSLTSFVTSQFFVILIGVLIILYVLSHGLVRFLMIVPTLFLVLVTFIGLVVDRISLNTSGENIKSFYMGYMSLLSAFIIGFAVTLAVFVWNITPSYREASMPAIGVIFMYLFLGLIAPLQGLHDSSSIDFPQKLKEFILGIIISILLLESVLLFKLLFEDKICATFIIP